MRSKNLFFPVVSAVLLYNLPGMLTRLSIQNYAIIDELEIDFSSQLNIITGETGAGKSIIVGALGLILGERADSSMLVNKQKKCFVEGNFGGDHKKSIGDFLQKHELDEHGEIVIRREIAINGKSRAFINDTPVTLAQLHELSCMLVDLHQQFDTLSLGESDFQRDVIDALAAQTEAVQDYSKLFSEWQKSNTECGELKSRKQQMEKESDYNQFQFDELDTAAFRENELEELDASLQVLTHSEGIRAALEKVYNALSESDTPLVQQLKILSQQLQSYASLHPGIPILISRIHSAQIELQDISDETDRISNHINHDPREIERITERLSQGYKLLKKHGVKTTAELLKIHRDLEEKLQDVVNIDEEIREKEKKTEQLFLQAKGFAEKISAARKKQAKPLEDLVNKLLVQVGMPNARLKLSIEDATLNRYGADEIDFLFDANRSNQFLPVRKVASGGELSRLMLCIKSLVAQSVDLPTLIFDEIDTGISGEAARQVGIIMKDLATKRQVICITHQPQIAGRADAHFFVYKQAIKDSVKTTIRLLDTDERITTIARMLSGEKPTAAAMANAREMVMN
jgi:DNA repair protein RecN (Recombination protein N)